MGRAKWPLAVVLACVLAAGGCSDSNDGNTDPLTMIESQVSILMQLLHALIEELDPFSPPPALTGGGGGGGCADVSAGICNISGTVLQCPTAGSDIDVDFNACKGVVTVPQTGELSFTVGGQLVYSPPPAEWPTGTRSVSAALSSGGDFDYEITLDGTVDVAVDVTDNDTGTQATCTGNLDTFAVDCELVTQ